MRIMYMKFGTPIEYESLNIFHTVTQNNGERLTHCKPRTPTHSEQYMHAHKPATQNTS
jgi:hypothetical protein